MTNRPPELVIGDPHEQPGLVARIPKGVDPVEIVNFYHYQFWPDKKAYCAKCGAHRHRDGFTVELDDGTFALTGSTCGADLWGERWRTVHSKFQAKLHDSGIILDVRPLLSELENIREALETSWRPIVNQVSVLQGRFKSSMGPLYHVLRAAALRPDHCVVLSNGKSTEFEGWAFFATDDLPKRFRLALEQIDAAIAAGHGKATELGVRTVVIGAAREHLDTIAHAARALRNFFTQQYLPSVVGAVNLSLGNNAYVSGVRSVVKKAPETEIGLPSDYPVINTEPLRKLRDLR
jgi:hypothetical protein